VLIYIEAGARNTTTYLMILLIILTKQA